MSQATIPRAMSAPPAETGRVATLVRLALTALAFALYATAVLSLHQERSAVFANEETGPIVAALSRRLDHAPLGFLDTALFHYFVTSVTAAVPAEQAVDQALDGAATPSNQLVVATDGIGIGGTVAAELAFTVFGPHARSLTLFYLLLIGVATALFVARYRDERMSAAPILLTALTLLLLTPLSDEPQVVQAPLGGIRSYALVVILPALHWCFELSDRRPGGWGRWMLLFGQLPILALGTMVRGSPLYLALPLLAHAGFALRRDQWSRWLSTTAILLVPAATVIAGVEATGRLGFPDYVAQGRAFPTIWHHAFLGLGVNPEWPLPEVREAFPCPDIAEGLVRMSDRNGHCIWWSYARRHDLSPAEVYAKLYGSEYEAALREAYFFVLRTYPDQVLKSYLFYKPRNIVRVVWREVSALSPTAAPSVVPLAILQIVLIIAFVAARPPSLPARDARWRLAVLAPFLIAVIAPLLIAWPAPHTVMDLLAYLLCGAVIALWLVVAGVFRLVGRRARVSRARP